MKVLSFQEFKLKVLKGVNDLSNSYLNKVEEESNEKMCSLYDSLDVKFYREYDRFRIHSLVFSDSGLGCYEVRLDETSYETLDDIKELYSSKYSLEINYVNILSVDYVYLTKASVLVEGVDLRSEKDRLVDSIIHILYVNDVMDKAVFITKRFPIRKFIPHDVGYFKKGVSGWSYSIVDDYLANGRMLMFLRADGNCISIERGSENISTNPSNLYLDLTSYCKSKDLVVLNCGTLGLQIAIK